MPLLPVLARMELAGVTDRPRRAGARCARSSAPTLAGLEARIYGLVGHEFNIGSPKQLEQILFTELELPATKRTRTGYSTDASVLEELREQARGGRPHPRAPPGVEAEVDLRRRAAEAGGRRRPPAHDLPAGGGRDRTPVEHRPEPPEHPDPHGARAAHPARVRGAAGQAAARRRLLAAGAAHPRPRLGRRRAARRTSPPTRTSISPPRPACWAWRPSRSAPKERQRGEDDQLRHRLRAERLRAGRAAEDPARGGAAASSPTTSPPTRASGATPSR